MYDKWDFWQTGSRTGAKSRGHKFTVQKTAHLLPDTFSSQTLTTNQALNNQTCWLNCWLDSHSYIWTYPLAKTLLFQVEPNDLKKLNSSETIALECDNPVIYRYSFPPLWSTFIFRTIQWDKKIRRYSAPLLHTVPTSGHHITAHLLPSELELHIPFIIPKLKGSSPSTPPSPSPLLRIPDTAPLATTKCINWLIKTYFCFLTASFIEFRNCSKRQSLSVLAERIPISHYRQVTAWVSLGPEKKILSGIK